MESICLIDLGDYERHGYIIDTRVAESLPGFSKYLDIGFNRQSVGWRDEIPHLHSNSDEFFIVLRGGINFLINRKIVSVEAGQLLGIRAELSHQVINVRLPIENFLIRVPGGGDDKVTLHDQIPDQPLDNPGSNNGIIKLDLHQDFMEYPIGACLPYNHPNYSPFLDFTCVWGTDPFDEWKNEHLHFHTLRKEYYFILRGRLDFEISGSNLSVSEGQILVVRPPVEHRVAGGCGPVDVLFARVPGGRGDKTVI
jgi:mannose-6-phosphate isomerase-like protein (cupin superfamily)